jgi:hypothetical protein
MSIICSPPFASWAGWAVVLFVLRQVIAVVYTNISDTNLFWLRLAVGLAVSVSASVHLLNPITTLRIIN